MAYFVGDDRTWSIPHVDRDIDKSFEHHEERQLQEERGCFANYLSEILNFLKFAWEHMPLGSIQLPLFDGNRQTYSTVCFRILGTLILLIFVTFVVTSFAKYGSLIQIRNWPVKYASNLEMSKEYDSISWVPNNLPFSPTFEMLNVKADPYNGFCENYNATVNGDGAARIAEVKFFIYKRVDDPSS